MRIEQSIPPGADGPHSAESRTVAEALVQFRQVLERTPPSGSTLGPVRDALQVICTHARKERMPPELLLIHLKHTLDGIPGLDAHSSDGIHDTRARIVSFVIDAYFAP